MVRIYHMDISRLHDKKCLNIELTISDFTMRSMSCAAFYVKGIWKMIAFIASKVGEWKANRFLRTLSKRKKEKIKCINFSDAILELSEN